MPMNNISAENLAAWIGRELCRRRCLSLGLAADLAGTDRAQFLAELAVYGIPVIDLPAGETQREFETVDAMLDRSA